MIPVLAAGATVYSVVTILLSLLQARTMLVRKESCDLSMTWLTASTGGYVIWLAYGIAAMSVPLMISDGLGLVCQGFTFIVAVVMHGSCVQNTVTAQGGQK